MAQAARAKTEQPHVRLPAAIPRARFICVRIPHLLIATTLLLSATVQAKG